MKTFIGFLLTFSIAASLCSCVSKTPKVIKTVTVPDDIPLMTYLVQMDAGRENSFFGFINAETFEIVIPAKYAWTEYFIGNFAVVKKHGEKNKDIIGYFSGYNDSLNYAIINKQDEEIIRNFDVATIYTSEDGRMTFALTANNSGVMRSGYRNDGLFRTHQLDPERTIYRLYNLTARKRVINRDVRVYDRGYDTKPRIRFVAHYLLYDDDVYTIKDNGSLEKTAITIQELMRKVIQERNLLRNENDFHFSGELGFNDPYFCYFDRLDIDAFFQNIPDNLALIWSGKNDWRFHDGKPAYAINPINRNKTYPLKENRLLYQAELTSSQNGEKYTDRSTGGDTYKGLYDAVENKWVIAPFKISGLSENFDQTEYDNWIHRGGWYYNIADRKRYMNQYSHITNYIYNISNMKSAMYYRGYVIEKYRGVIVAQDF
jgi:hypothetical protein